ncbi:unnamed protein product, partial [Ectocarpus fasciculatus]
AVATTGALLLAPSAPPESGESVSPTGGKGAGARHRGEHHPHYLRQANTLALRQGSPRPAPQGPVGKRG